MQLNPRIGAEFVEFGTGSSPEHVDEALLRAGTEALTNVARHRHAHTVRVTVERGTAAVTVRVRDDGNGFVPDTAAGGHGTWPWSPKP